MSVHDILSSLDEEIGRLQQARQLLSDGTGATHRATTKTATKRVGRKKRGMTPEGRQRVAEAMRRRWAAKKKAS